MSAKMRKWQCLNAIVLLTSFSCRLEYSAGQVSFSTCSESDISTNFWSSSLGSRVCEDHISDKLIVFCHLPYSVKFSWVQIFADMPSDPSEEILVVFIFVGYACSSDHTPILTRIYVHYVAIRDVRGLVKIFVVFIFAVTCR